MVLFKPKITPHTSFYILQTSDGLYYFYKLYSINKQSFENNMNTYSKVIQYKASRLW